MEDLNDNPPVFRKLLFSANVSEDIQPGQTLLQLKAEDRDVGDNAAFQFSFLSDTENEIKELFYLGVNFKI